MCGADFFQEEESNDRVENLINVIIWKCMP